MLNKALKHTLAFLTIFLGYYPGLPVIADVLTEQLPNMGDAGASVLSPEEERLLGQEFMRNVTQRFTLLDDPLASRYAQDLGDRLLSQYSNHQQQISVFIVDDPSINAFAGPGGHIGIHTGLILAARTEAELASVLAHEIAHVVQRHLVRRFETSQRQSLKTMGAVIAAILLGGTNSQASEAILSSAIAGNVQQQLSYSRTHEQEADRIGIELLARAEFDPRAMSIFFTTLQKHMPTGESKVPEFIRTHPLTSSRIADTESRAESYPKIMSTDDHLFRLTQVRIAAGAKQQSRALSAFRQDLQSGITSPKMQQYSQVLTALYSGDYQQARDTMIPLLKNNPHQLHFHYSAAEIELADNQAKKAQQILREILKLYPGNIPLTSLQAKTLLQLNKPEDAFTLLKETISHNGVQPALYMLYAEAALQTNNEPEAYRALAELHYSQGDIHQAITYLEQALAAVTLTPYEKLSLESRLGMIKKEAKGK